MSEAKHTPGPWVITRGQQEPTSKAGHMFVRQGPGVYGAFVCHVHPRNGEATETEVVYDAEAEANARLIAAAPDMLAELRATADWLEQRAEVLGGIAAMAGVSRHRAPQLRDEAARLQGRAVVIRQTILKATGG